MATTFVKRLERVERAVREKRLGQPLTNCICFPDAGRSPFFLYPGIRELAFRLKCSLHGDRFQPVPAEVPTDDPSRVDLEVGWTWRHASEQYRKAWNATFQNGEWPTEEISVEGRVWRLPHSAGGRFLDWKNVSSAPPWKRVHARTLGDDTIRKDRELEKEPKSRAGRVQRTRNLEAENLLEQWGCRDP
jgi:hypothetical protein